MILSNRMDEFVVPHTSTCMIKTKGVINDGDMITVVSPSFASYDMITGIRITSETFNVPIKIMNESKQITSDGINTKGTLVSNDNDTLNMYVVAH